MNNEDILFTLLNFLTWATPRTIFEINEELEEKLNDLKDEDFGTLYNTLRETTKRSRFTKSQMAMFEKKIQTNKFSQKLIVLISQRFARDFKSVIIYNKIEGEIINGVDLSEMKLEFIIQKYLDNPEDEKLLENVKTLYASSTEASRTDQFYYRRARHSRFKIPYESAKKIMESPIEYPRIISSLAETSCRHFANLNIKEVSQIAKEEKWFEKASSLA